MPTIAFFSGVTVYMYWADHGPPHLHAIHTDGEAVSTYSPAKSSTARCALGRGAWSRTGSSSAKRRFWKIGSEANLCYPSSVYPDPTMTSEMIKIRKVRPASGKRLAITFEDGAHGVHDLAWLFEKSGPMLEPLRDQAMFERVFLEMGALTWPNGFDLSPWNVRERMQEAGELMPAGVAAE
jgi:hypothetical protein